jgi:UDP-N-acetylmuramyl pentapeptide phosphotransferase/UDP-N-acetylglucosamine-1-phosphate transferase
MFDVLLSLAISFTIAFLAIPAIITVAESKKLFDVPDERKIHQAHIPSLGGLGIFAGFMLACLLSISLSVAPEFQYFLAAAMVMFFLGLKDDILVISPIKKFIGQVLASFLIIYKGGVQITSMHGFLGINELPEMFSILLTYFTVIVIINSFNLIDGIDGLAGTLGIIAASIFGSYFLAAGMVPYAVLGFSLAGSLTAFLIFNYHPAKIFMGDTGSMLIGLVNAVLVIKFISVAQTPGISVPVYAAPAIGFTVLLIPLLDTLRVFGIRIFHQRSPFIPDRNHIHHLMLDKGWSHNTITFTLAGFALAFVVTAYTFRQAGCTWIILAGISFFFTGIAMLYYTRSHPRLFVARMEPAKPEHHGSTKIVPLTKDIVLEQQNLKG